MLSASNPFGTPVTPEQVDALTAPLWASTEPLLRHVAAVADYYRVHPLAVLNAAKAHLATGITPAAVLVNQDGNPLSAHESGTSLNAAYMLIGESHAGKSRCLTAARAIVKPFVEPYTGGTGQGFAKSFNSQKLYEEKDADGNVIDRAHKLYWMSRSVFWSTDEFEDVDTELFRPGSRTEIMFRPLVFGQMVGMNNGDQTRNAYLPPQLYRFVALWVSQTSKMGNLLSMYDGGTPQRLIYAPVKVRKGTPRTTRTTEPTFTRKQHPLESRDKVSAGSTVGNIAVSNGTSITGWDESVFPSEERKDAIRHPLPIHIHWSDAMRREVPLMQAELEESDVDAYGVAHVSESDRERRKEAEVRGHSILTMIKDAALTSILLGHTDRRDDHNNFYISDTAWEIAKIVGTVSMGMLSVCFDDAKYLAQLDNTAAGKTQGARNHVAKETQTFMAEEQMDKDTIATMRALARLRVDAAESLPTTRELQMASRISSENMQVALRNLLSNGLVDVSTKATPKGERITAARMSEAAMSNPAVVEYLDKERPEWRAA